MPRDVFVRGGKYVTDQAGCSRVDVAVGADETGRNRAHPTDDARCTSIATVTRRRHCAYIVCESAMARYVRPRPGCLCCSNISRTSLTLVASSGFFSVRIETMRGKRNANPGWSPLMPAV